MGGNVKKGDGRTKPLKAPKKAAKELDEVDIAHQKKVNDEKKAIQEAANKLRADKAGKKSAKK